MFKNASVICASMIVFEQGGTLVRVLSHCLNRMPVFAQESLVGYPLLLWQYTSAAARHHRLQLPSWPYAWSF